MTQGTDAKRVAVVGLGYVGLPLAVEFARKHKVVGFDIDQGKIAELKGGHDRMRELSDEELRSVTIDYTSDPKRIAEAEFVIICVPTPVDRHNNPDLELVASAARTVGAHLS